MGSRRSSDLSEHLETLFQVGATGDLSDAQLLEQFITTHTEAGEAAFRALVQRHGPMVLGVCRSVLHDLHNAEDAFQVTFLALSKKASSIRKHASIASWLHGTAHRVALKARTAARRRRARESKVAEAAVDKQSRQIPIEDRELSPILHEEIERLPAKYRSPIVLCYLEGMTQERAATELGWPPGTVRGRLARARELLRARLTRRGLTLSAGLVASGQVAEAAAVGLSACLVEATVGAALGRSAAGRLSRAAAMLLKAVLRDMAAARVIQIIASLVLIAGLAGGAAVFIYIGGTKPSGRRVPVATMMPAARPAATNRAGDPLPSGALLRLGTTRLRAGSTILQTAYSPDGRLLASIDGDGDLDLWDAATGRQRLSIALNEKNGMRIQGMVFAPDGRSMAVHTSQTTTVHDTASGRPIRRLEEKSLRHDQSAQARSLAFSPDGSMLAASFYDAPIVVWEVLTGRRLRSFDADSQGHLHLTFTPDGTGLISTVTSASSGPAFPGDKKTRPEESLIQVWEVATGRTIRRIALGTSQIGEIALAPGGQAVAVTMTGREARDPDGKVFFDSTADRSIRLYEVATGREVRRFGGKEAIPRGLAFKPDGAMLASGEETFNPASFVDNFPRSTMLHLWDVTTAREVRRWEVRALGTTCLAFAPAGTDLAWVGGNENVIRIWDPSAGREVRPHDGHRGAIGDALFTPDGRSLVTVSEDRTLRFWDPATGTETRRIEASDERIWFAALSADGKALATGGGLRPARRWDAASGAMLREFSISGEHFTWCGDLSADGKTLATSEDAGVIFWDAATGRRRVAAGRPISRQEARMIKSLRFAPDGQSVATLGGDWVRFWDVARAEETRRFALPNKGPLDMFLAGARLVFSPDGRTLAVTSERDGRIFLLDAASGRELDRLDGPQNKFKALAFSPDGRILATGIDTGKLAEHRERAIRLWDVAARQELGRVPAHRAYIRALAFSADGRRLVSASEDGTALVWDVAQIIGRRTAAAESRGPVVPKVR